MSGDSDSFCIRNLGIPVSLVPALSAGGQRLFW